MRDHKIFILRALVASAGIISSTGVSREEISSMVVEVVVEQVNAYRESRRDLIQRVARAFFQGEISSRLVLVERVLGSLGIELESGEVQPQTLRSIVTRQVERCFKVMVATDPRCRRQVVETAAAELQKDVMRADMRALEARMKVMEEHFKGVTIEAPTSTGSTGIISALGSEAVKAAAAELVEKKQN